MALRPLDRLCEYMNFLRLAKDPPAVLTMDHRAVLCVAWAAMRQGIFPEPPLLFRFDAHPDMGERPREWAHELALLTDLDAVHAVANDQRLDDGGWVVSAMQFGLAGDVATCFLHDYHRFPGDNGEYVDHRGATHQLWAFATLEEVLAPDPGPRRARLLDALASRPVWLDIDLDFATARGPDDSVRPWTEPEMAAALGRPRERDFVLGLSRRASLITVASEPEFAGGLTGVGKVAEMLKGILGRELEWIGNL